MKTYKYILLIIGLVACGVAQAEKRNRSDLYTTGMSDAFQNPEDSFDQLHAHNHSIDGDNLDWNAHSYHTGGTCSHCKKCSAPVAIGYQSKK